MAEPDEFRDGKLRIDGWFDWNGGRWFTYKGRRQMLWSLGQISLMKAIAKDEHLLLSKADAYVLLFGAAKGPRTSAERVSLCRTLERLYRLGCLRATQLAVVGSPRGKRFVEWMQSREVGIAKAERRT